MGHLNGTPLNVMRPARSSLRGREERRRGKEIPEKCRYLLHAFFSPQLVERQAITRCRAEM
jgi:hypothetical protein